MDLKRCSKLELLADKKRNIACSYLSWAQHLLGPKASHRRGTGLLVVYRVKTGAITLPGPRVRLARMQLHNKQSSNMSIAAFVFN